MKNKTKKTLLTVAAAVLFPALFSEPGEGTGKLIAWIAIYVAILVAFCLISKAYSGLDSEEGAKG
jgi:hypothetical protein